MAIDQYGNTHHHLGAFPRKALLEKFGRKHSQRIFREKKDGACVCVGWVIAGMWFNVYNVSQMEIT